MNIAIEAQMYSDNYNFLGGLQDWMNNGSGFNELCFDIQPQQFEQDHPLQNLQQLNENSCLDNTVLVPKNNNNNDNNGWMTFSESIALQVENQRQEMDKFISIQNERLRMALLQQRKYQVALLLKNYESKIQILLRQKDEEISRATNRAMELEEISRRIEIENQTWQRVAIENEAMVVSLNNTLKELKESAYLVTNTAEDAESCFEIIREGEEENEGFELEKENEQKTTTQVICKSCNSRNPSMIFLPCRHLCACKDCETLLDSCPVCSMVKKAVIEALI